MPLKMFLKKLLGLIVALGVGLILYSWPNITFPPFCGQASSQIYFFEDTMINSGYKFTREIPVAEFEEFLKGQGYSIPVELRRSEKDWKGSAFVSNPATEVQERTAEKRQVSFLPVQRVRADFVYEIALQKGTVDGLDTFRAEDGHEWENVYVFRKLTKGMQQQLQIQFSPMIVDAFSYGRTCD